MLELLLLRLLRKSKLGWSRRLELLVFGLGLDIFGCVFIEIKGLTKAFGIKVFFLDDLLQ